MPKLQQINEMSCRVRVHGQFSSIIKRNILDCRPLSPSTDNMRQKFEERVHPLTEEEGATNTFEPRESPNIKFIYNQHSFYR